jgi:hypothetical protein
VYRLRLLLRLSLVAALAYCLFILAWRYFNARQVELARQEDEAKRNAEFNRIYGSNELKILQFYASTPVISAGEAATLCYGVLNAKSVAIDPPVDGVGLSISRCVAAYPKQTTKYALSATDRDGRVVSVSTEVRVKPAR